MTRLPGPEATGHPPVAGHLNGSAADPIGISQGTIAEVGEFTGKEKAPLVQVRKIGVDKNTTVVFPAPLMSTIEELGSFIASEKAAASLAAPASSTMPAPLPVSNGAAKPA